LSERFIAKKSKNNCPFAQADILRKSSKSHNQVNQGSRDKSETFLRDTNPIKQWLSIRWIKWLIL